MTHGNAREIALKHFANRFNCSESTLMGLAEAFGIKERCIPRIATGLGDGLGGCGDSCGALTGAAMAISLKFGRESAEDLESKTLCYHKVRQLVEAFEKEFGSARCIDLIEVDMRTPEGMARARELDLHNKVCPAFVGFAADMAQRLIEEG